VLLVGIQRFCICSFDYWK